MRIPKITIPEYVKAGKMPVLGTAVTAVAAITFALVAELTAYKGLFVLAGAFGLGSVELGTIAFRHIRAAEKKSKQTTSSVSTAHESSGLFPSYTKRENV